MYFRHAIRKDVTEDVNYMTDIKPYRNPKRHLRLELFYLKRYVNFYVLYQRKSNLHKQKSQNVL